MFRVTKYALLAAVSLVGLAAVLAVRNTPNTAFPETVRPTP